MRRMATVLLVLAVWCFPSLGNAQGVEVGTGLICDTAEQVKQFVVAFNGGVGNEAALQAVNAEAKTNACGVASIAYLKGEKVGAIRTKDGNANIHQIVVVGINVGAGWVRGAPMVQYTLFLTKEEEA